MDDEIEFTDTQIRIMETALELISEYGYRGTTTRMIAERSDFNELTLFRNFESKEMLLRKALRYELNSERMHNEIPQRWSGDAETDLFDLCILVRNNLRRRKHLIRIMLREQSSNPVVEENVSSVPLIWKEIIVKTISGIIEGTARKGTDVEVASLLIASYILRGEMMTAVLGFDPFDSNTDEKMKVAVGIFLHGIMEGGSG
ncbi:MAG: TetR/AcrR family transcriptional regulator [Thermoplasmatota archaeon]